MSSPISKFAPIAVVAALVAWLCWPYLDGAPSERPGLEPEAPPEIADSLLEPDLGSPSDRDPFHDPTAKEKEKTDAAPAKEPTTAVVVAEEKPPPGEPIEKILGRLVVDATFIHGSRRIALIDGHLYKEGDSLRISKLPADACVVAWISAHKVMIRHLNGVVELTYRDPTAKADSPSPTDAPEAANQGSEETTVSTSDVF